MDSLLPMLILAAAFLVVLLGSFALYAAFYKKVDQGRALIVNTTAGEPTVTFTGKLVLPVFHRAETMDISVRTIDLDRRGKDGLICRDNIRADIKVAFFVRVNKTSEDVLKVAQSIGCTRASDQDTLEQLFVAKFSEALKTVGKRLEFEELYTKRDEFRDEIVQVIGKDLNGYVLEDAAIDYLEQTQIENLDPQNILDSQGIRKITEMTAAQNIATNHLRQEEKKAIRKQDVDAAEKILELDRQYADAQAKQTREVAIIQAREQAETRKVQAEEHQRAEIARIKQEENVQVEDQNRQRQVEIAMKARERAVAVEGERVERDRQLEAIQREREVELQRIEKEKALEVERKAIADSVAARIAVDKTVAEEEERIKDLRVVADAKRTKDASVIAAEAEAQRAVVKHVKEAEAREVAAKHAAAERLTTAEAELEAADRHARAKMRMAEGAQAEAAASGLAAARVKEADAIATEKHGKADAEAAREMLLAEAAGTEAKGMAEIKVRQAEADAVERMGTAEAQAVRQRMEAEALGLSQKADAMQKLDGVGREHEEYRLALEKDKEIALRGLDTQREIAEQNASILAEAMKSARINLVGGDGKFLDQFFRAVSVGQSLDATVASSDTVKQALREYLEGDASVRADVVDVLRSPRLDADTLKNLSVTAFLTQLASRDGVDRDKLTRLIARARELGLD